MSWQGLSAMNNPGVAGGGEHNAPAGTEYTLQGELPSSTSVITTLLARVLQAAY